MAERSAPKEHSALIEQADVEHTGMSLLEAILAPRSPHRRAQGTGAPPGGFLDLPQRTSKPRTAGITHVIDMGTPVEQIEARLASCGSYIDVWKFGFGTSYLDGETGAKNAVLRDHGVKSCPGGTLLEIAWRQGRAAEFLDWAGVCGFDCVEVSRGATGLPVDVKRRLIELASRCGFEVFAETGSKDPDACGDPDDWAEEARGDADSGAAWIVAEGRSSGTVGLYTPDGDVRAGVVGALEELSASCGVPVVYEAPRRSQQAWLISRLGANAGLGNIRPALVLGLEALRVGLRADTLETL